jgi:hypothetical protein
MGTFMGLAFAGLRMTLGGACLGFFVLGPAFSYRERRDDVEAANTVDDYPEVLKEVERRYAGYDLVLMPIVILTGIGASWLIFGVGWYGVLGGFIAGAAVSWIIGRLGGPNDPRWRKVRDDWRSSHNSPLLTEN